MGHHLACHLLLALHLSSREGGWCLPHLWWEMDGGKKDEGPRPHQRWLLTLPRGATAIQDLLFLFPQKAAAQAPTISLLLPTAGCCMPGCVLGAGGMGRRKQVSPVPWGHILPGRVSEIAHVGA